MAIDRVTDRLPLRLRTTWRMRSVVVCALGAERADALARSLEQ